MEKGQKKKYIYIDKRISNKYTLKFAANSHWCNYFYQSDIESAKECFTSSESEIPGGTMKGSTSETMSAYFVVIHQYHFQKCRCKRLPLALFGLEFIFPLCRFFYERDN